MAEASAEKLPAHKRDDLKFKSGSEWNGNAAGRPKGSRNKLGEAFLEALHDDFAEHGVGAIEEVRKDKPDQYLKVIASTLPKELNVKVSELDELSDDQLARQLAAGLAALAKAGFDVGQGTGQAQPSQPLKGLPTLQ